MNINSHWGQPRKVADLDELTSDAAAVASLRVLLKYETTSLTDGCF